MFFNSFFRDAGFDDYFNYGFENTRQNGTDTTLYEILGLNKDATDGQIRKAYLQLAKQHHPDKGGDQKIVFVIIPLFISFKILQMLMKFYQIRKSANCMINMV